jgi:hypothetical protein
MTPVWVSVIGLLGWLFLSWSALRAQQLNGRKTVIYGLIWGAIFFAVAGVFGALS